MKFAHLFDEVFGSGSEAKPDLIENRGESGEAVRSNLNRLNANETRLTSNPEISHRSHHAAVRLAQEAVRRDVIEVEEEIEASHRLTNLTVENGMGEAASVDAFGERAAIVQHDGGLGGAEAEDQAARDQGYADADAFREAVVAGWRQRVNAWGAGQPKAAFRQRLLADARAFCDSDMAITALKLGWSELDLFAVHGEAPEARFDCCGLIASLNGRPIAVMTADTASIRCPAGHCLTYRRRPIDPRQGAVLLWELGA